MFLDFHQYHVNIFVSILAKNPSELVFQGMYVLENLLTVFKMGNHFGMWINISTSGQIA